MRKSEISKAMLPWFGRYRQFVERAADRGDKTALQAIRRWNKDAMNEIMIESGRRVPVGRLPYKGRYLDRENPARRLSRLGKRFSADKRKYLLDHIRGLKEAKHPGYDKEVSRLRRLLIQDSNRKVHRIKKRIVRSKGGGVAFYVPDSPPKRSFKDMGRSEIAEQLFALRMKGKTPPKAMYRALVGRPPITHRMNYGDRFWQGGYSKIGKRAGILSGRQKLVNHQLRNHWLSRREYYPGHRNIWQKRRASTGGLGEAYVRRAMDGGTDELSRKIRQYGITSGDLERRFQRFFSSRP